jgi:hypothetical protein
MTSNFPNCGPTFFKKEREARSLHKDLRKCRAFSCLWLICEHNVGAVSLEQPTLAQQKEIYRANLKNYVPNFAAQITQRGIYGYKSCQ